MQRWKRILLLKRRTAGEVLQSKFLIVLGIVLFHYKNK